MSFVHLHSHSHFSLGEGVSSPEAMLEAAAARGFTALACTDTNGVYGAVEFQQAAESTGIRPILGAQLKSGGEETVALAMDDRGWGALCRAITEVHWRTGGRADRRTEQRELTLSDHLSADRQGLILLSADSAFLERVHRASGPADLYAELRPGKERHAVLATARRLGIPPVVTGAAMFANSEDWSRHRLRVAISENATLSACPPVGSRRLAPPRPRTGPPLSRLPRGARRHRSHRRSVPVPDPDRSDGGTTGGRSRRCPRPSAHPGP